MLSTGGRGIDVGADVDVELVQVEVTGTTEAAIFADGVSRLALDRVYVHDTDDAGVWAQSRDACDDSALPVVSLDRVYVDEARLVGVALVGVDATIRSSQIIRTLQSSSEGGGFGLGSSQCSKLDVEDLRIDDSGSFGAVVFDSSGNLGSDGDARGIIIINGRSGGIWLDAASSSAKLTLRNFDIQDSQGIGIGVGADARGIIIINGHVMNTESAMQPLRGGGSEDVGDGLLWNAGAAVDVDGITIEGSGRNAVLIDGAVGATSALRNVTFAGSDADKTIIQQQVMGPDSALSTDMAPTVEDVAGEQYAVPAAPVFSTP